MRLGICVGARTRLGIGVGVCPKLGIGVGGCTKLSIGLGAKLGFGLGSELGACIGGICIGITCNGATLDIGSGAKLSTTWQSERLSLRCPRGKKLNVQRIAAVAAIGAA